MMRRVLLYLAGADWARNAAMRWPVARRVARRFVAGETLDEAIEATRQLSEKGIYATLDYLGESITRAEDTEPIVATYQALAQRIHEAGLHTASISVKLTHLGLDIGEDLCVTNMRHILTTAQQHNIPVTIDMESSAYVDVTLRIYRTLRDEYGFDNVGTVIQSYLYRSEADMQELAAESAHIRLVKGAYLEPPDVAFPQKADVDQNFVKLTELFLTASTDAYLCQGTHDEKMIQATERIAQQHNIPNDRYEYQMLYGVRQDRQLELAQAGKTMRVYVPFGETWYPYFMRRLAERPANVWFFARAFFG